MTPAPRATAPLPRAALDPGPDEARDRLRRELLDPDYQDRDLLGRALDWFGRQLDRATSAASSASPLVVVAAMLLLVGLLLAVAWLVSRARWAPARQRTSPVVTAGEVVRADDLARRARQALEAGDPHTGLVEGFRALAVRGVERGVLTDLPGATAREVAGVLATAVPGREADLHAAADAFDAALYGDRRPDAAPAERVLALDAWLGDAATARPAAAPGSAAGGARRGGPA